MGFSRKMLIRMQTKGFYHVKLGVKNKEMRRTVESEIIYAREVEIVSFLMLPAPKLVMVFAYSFCQGPWSKLKPGFYI